MSNPFCLFVYGCSLEDIPEETYDRDSVNPTEEGDTDEGSGEATGEDRLEEQ